MRCFFYGVLLLVAGCGKPVKQDQPVALDKVPEPVMKAALTAIKEKFPDVKFHSATLRPNGVYEITGKSKTGKVHDVELSASGEVLEVE
ncbi:MAG TPA: hypothetical protein VGJ26_01860 [Pirellulales bacterium]|jgi:hypothetical protein